MTESLQDKINGILCRLETNDTHPIYLRRYIDGAIQELRDQIRKLPTFDTDSGDGDEIECVDIDDVLSLIGEKK